MPIPNRLRAARQERGYSLHQLARDLDLDPSYLARIERNEAGAATRPSCASPTISASPWSMSSSSASRRPSVHSADAILDALPRSRRGLIPVRQFLDAQARRRSPRGRAGRIRSRPSTPASRQSSANVCRSMCG